MNFQENSSHKIQKNQNEIPLINKLYVWSLIFEPMTYFSFAGSGEQIGIPFSFSKLLQILVILYLIIKFSLFNRGELLIYFNQLKINTNFIFHVFIILFSTLIGSFYLSSFDINKFGLLADGAQFSDGILKSYYFRPFFDLFILLYYYFYFIILPLLFFKNSRAFFYLTKWTFFTIYVNLVIGYLDLFISPLIGKSLIPRHIDDDVDVGFRFHGFLGEPRDAFIYLCFSLFLVLMAKYFYFKVFKPKVITLLILAALAFTQSGSGIFGIIIGGSISFIYFLNRKSVYAIKFLLIALILAGGIIVLVNNSPRLMAYAESFSDIMSYVSSGDKIPDILLSFAVNYLPLVAMYNYFLASNFYPILFGSGLSSSAYYNISFIGDPNFSNPHAQITRIIFETGIVGTVFYIMFLCKPVINFIKSESKKGLYYNLLSFFVLIGSTLSQRSMLSLIIFGMVNCFINIKGTNKQMLNR